MQVLAASPVPTICPVGQAAKQDVPSLLLIGFVASILAQVAHTGGSAVFAISPAPHATH